MFIKTQLFYRKSIAAFLVLQTGRIELKDLTEPFDYFPATFRLAVRNQSSFFGKCHRPVYQVMRFLIRHFPQCLAFLKTLQKFLIIERVDAKKLF